MPLESLTFLAGRGQQSSQIGILTDAKHRGNSLVLEQECLRKKSTQWKKTKVGAVSIDTEYKT